MPEKCFFTVATGLKYLSFAFTLARSYRLHNQSNGIPFYILSDSDFRLPADLHWVNKVAVDKNTLGTGLYYRFRFADIAPAGRSIFIDSDSIIYGDLSSLFNIKNSSVRVIGKTEVTGNWANLQLPDALTDFNIPHVIRYCGAFYMIEKNELSADICKEAERLSEVDYNFQYHTKSLNDEPVFSISMVKHGVTAYPDDGNIWSDTAQLRSHKDLNTLNKKAAYLNSREFKYKAWLPLGPYHPLIVHFGGDFYNKNPWVFDALRLNMLYKYHLPKWLCKFIVNNIFKPAYFSIAFIRKGLSN